MINKKIIILLIIYVIISIFFTENKEKFTNTLLNNEFKCYNKNNLKIITDEKLYEKCGIKYGDSFLLNLSNHLMKGNSLISDNTNATLDKNKVVKFEKGSIDSGVTIFLLPPIDGNKKNGDLILYGDQVVFSLDDKYDLVGSINKGGKKRRGRNLQFISGVEKPSTFYLRPEIINAKQVEGKHGKYIKQSDNFVIAYEGENKPRKGCGWYGCRVAIFKSNYIRFDHGQENPPSFRFKKIITTCDIRNDDYILGKTKEINGKKHFECVSIDGFNCSNNCNLKTKSNLKNFNKPLICNSQTDSIGNNTNLCNLAYDKFKINEQNNVHVTTPPDQTLESTPPDQTLESTPPPEKYDMLYILIGIGITVVIIFFVIYFFIV
jgi:hypothetical protein